VARNRLVLVALACAALPLLAAALLDLSLQRALLLAPLIVAAAGAAVGLVLLWTRVAWESLQRRRHPGRIVAIAIAVVALLLVASYFVGPLPHE